MKTLLLIICVFIGGQVFAQHAMEQHDCGLVAVQTTSGVFVSWRIPGDEWQQTTYNVYRNGQKLNDLPLEVSNLIACKTAPGSKDRLGNFISKGPAALANHTADYRNSGGYILSGPEYLTVFSGRTGEELSTLAYQPPRGNVSDWGDGYGNRVDRFLAAVAYLDGEKPSLVMTRGYYTRSVLAAYDFDGNQPRGHNGATTTHHDQWSMGL